MIGTKLDPGSEASNTAPRVVLDCRWLGLGGPGRVTEIALRDLLVHRPPWATVLWGEPTRLREFKDLGEIRAWRGGFPGSRFGQAGILNVPTGDLVVFFHQVRPLIAQRSLSFIHDTIPLRYGGSPFTRWAKRWFLTRIANSARVITVSAYSRDSIAHDLGIDADKIDVASIPIDGPRFDSIAIRRRGRDFERVALYVGRLAPHKNIPMLLDAFTASSFGRDGGRLLLVGGSGRERRELEPLVATLRAVEMVGHCSEAELDERLARSQLLVMPSLDEGFGLPPFEAAAVGMPVAVSRTGAMSEIPEEIASFCDPRNSASIADAIDSAAARLGVAPVYRRAGDLGRAVTSSAEKALAARR